MIQTSYTCVDTTDLITFALGRDCGTELEKELAQRLQLAVDLLDEAEDILSYDTRRTSQRRY